MAKNLKLKAARAALDMTQADLAAVVGVSRQTINAIEKGEYNPTINLCRSICRVLCFALLQLIMQAYKKRHAELENPKEDDDENE